MENNGKYEVKSEFKGNQTLIFAVSPTTGLTNLVVVKDEKADKEIIQATNLHYRIQRVYSGVDYKRVHEKHYSVNRVKLPNLSNTALDSFILQIREDSR